MARDLTRIGFLVFPGFPMACLTSMIEPLRAANEISGKTAFAWALLSEDGGKVMSSADVVFEPEATLRHASPDLDFLVLLSAPTARFSDPGTAGFLNSRARHGTRLGAVSGGVFPLARAKLINDATVSVHWCYAAAFDAEFPQINASDRVLEIGPRIITASGAAAAFDLALHMVEQALDDAIATEVACWFQHPMMRKEGVQQSVPVPSKDTAQEMLPPLVAQAVDLASKNLSDPLSVAALADALGVSPRHLERSFKHATGQNPSTYLRKLRLKAARQIVMYSNDRILDIALAVGYSSSKSFIRHYTTEFDVTPKEDRLRINLYRAQGTSPVPSV